MERTAAVVVIGNEVLSGVVVESNATFLIHELRLLGVSLKRILFLPDEIDTIAEHVVSVSRLFDYVFTTGGVGPTHDDVTLASIAQAFGRPLERHQEFADILSKAYGPRLTEQALTMADLPRGTELVGKDALNVPVVRVENVYIFPGVPGLLRHKFGAIKEMFRTTPFWVHRVILRSEESRVALHVKAVQEHHPRVRIGSYPMFEKGSWQVMLSLESKDPETLAPALGELISGLPAEEILRVERAGCEAP